MDGCVFCKIASREIPSCLVDENEKVVAFMDISPARKGHILVVPKRHAQNMIDVSMDDCTAMIQMVKRVACALEAALCPAGLSIVQLNGAASGQTVFHIHFHIIPRQGGDGPVVKWAHETYAAGEIECYRDRIAKALQKDKR